MFNRYRFVLWMVAAMALQIGAVGCASKSAEQWRGPFVFVVASDPQLGMYSDNKDTVKDAELLEKAIAKVNRLQPEFLLICGDLVNKPGDEQQNTRLSQILANLDRRIDLHLVSGNHDLENVPTAWSVQSFSERFGRDYYSFDQGGCHFVVLNSTLMHRPDRLAREEQRQMAWLKEDLKKSSARRPTHTIVFQHHAPFVKNADEPNDYHSIPRERRKELLELYQANKVSVVFSGHLHRCARGKWKDVDLFTVGPVGKPLGKDPSGLCVVKVYEDRVEYQYLGLDEVPATVELAR